MLILGELQNSSIANIARSNVAGPVFLAQLDEAMRSLLRKGDWVGTVVPMRFCIQRGCITLPRIVDHIRKLSVCDRPVPIHNLFFDYIDPKAREYRHFWTGGRQNVVKQGNYPIYNDIPGDGWTVRAFCTKAVDYGKKIQIFGTDTNGQPLQTQNPDTSWSDGITLTLANPYVDSGIQVRRIDRVIKDPTAGRVFLYAAFANTGLATANIGYVWNTDTNAPVSLTALGLVGFQYLALGTANPPSGSANIGYLYNLTLNQWQPIIARGQPGAYYLQIGQSGPVGAGGVQVYNTQISSYQPIVLYGQVGQEYVGIGGASAPTNYGTTLADLARYEGSETNPSYERIQVHLPHIRIPKPQSVPQGCCNQMSAIALVKLKYIKAVNPSDPIIIDNIEAIKSAIQAIQFKEGGDLEEGVAYYQDAVNELNRQLQDSQPETEIPVALGETNGGSWGNQKVF